MILVTGATGRVGGEVVRQLAGRDEPPRALVRDRQRARQRLGEGVDLAVADLDRPETLEPTLAGVDRIFLLTTQSTRQVAQERSLIRAAVRAGVGHVVKLSVFRADMASPLQVARQHGEAERALAEAGLSHTIIRPPFFMQNLLGMVRDGAIFTAAQDGRVAMVDVRDIAAVAVAALTSPGHEGETYTPTGPEAVTFDDVAAIVSEQTGVPLRHVRVPPDRVRAALEAAGVRPWFAADMANLHTMLAAGYEDVVTADVRTAAGRPPRALAQFARDFAAAFTRQRKAR